MVLNFVKVEMIAEWVNSLNEFVGYKHAMLDFVKDLADLAFYITSAVRRANIVS